MANFIKLAWRNILRNRRRTIITGSAIIAGVTLLVITGGIITGMLERTINNSVELETGHIKVYPKGYHEVSDLMPANMHISNYAGVIGIIEEIDGVKYTSPRIRARGILEVVQSTAHVIINGIDPEVDSEIRDLRKRIIEGEHLVNEDLNIITIGATLADRLKIGLNDEVLLSSVAADGSAVSTILKVRAIFSTGFSDYDSSMIFLPLSQAQNMLKIEHEKATEIVIMVDNPKQIEGLTASIASELRDKGYDYDVFHWEQLAPELAQFVDLQGRMAPIFLYMVLIVAAFGILNTMLMSTYERVKEIGVMAAFGYKRQNILVLFLLEGLMIGVIGALLGCILGAGVTHYLSVVGIDFGAGMGVVEFMEVRVYPGLSIHDVIYPFLFAVGISLLASLYPAYKASKLEPVEALRHV